MGCFTLVAALPATPEHPDAGHPQYPGAGPFGPDGILNHQGLGFSGHQFIIPKHPIPGKGIYGSSGHARRDGNPEHPAGNPGHSEHAGNGFPEFPSHPARTGPQHPGAGFPGYPNAGQPGHPEHPGIGFPNLLSHSGRTGPQHPGAAFPGHPGGGHSGHHEHSSHPGRAGLAQHSGADFSGYLIHPGQVGLPEQQGYPGFPDLHSGLPHIHHDHEYAGNFPGYPNQSGRTGPQHPGHPGFPGQVGHPGQYQLPSNGVPGHLKHLVAQG